MKYLRIESNIKTIEGNNSLLPISFEVDENSEEKDFLKQADEAYPNPAEIFTDCEGVSPRGSIPVTYNMMILKVSE
tara:strand:+ start:1324 stop:1551 length:228 start_codon:yes stop_codon:yes gene_type:complete